MFIYVVHLGCLSRMFTFSVNLFDLEYLVHIVHIVYLVHLIHLKEPNKTKIVLKMWKKSKRGGGGSALKIKKSTIHNIDSFEMRGEVRIFRYFPISND